MLVLHECMFCGFVGQLCLAESLCHFQKHLWSIRAIAWENMQEIGCIILGVHQWPGSWKRCACSTTKFNAGRLELDLKVWSKKMAMNLCKTLSSELTTSFTATT